MKIYTIKSGNTNCFLLFYEDLDVGILIDAGVSNDTNFIKKVAKNIPVNKIRYLILTHGHYDHVGNAALLQQKYHVKVVLHQKEQFNVEQGIMDFPPASGFFSNIIRIISLKNIDKATYTTFKPDMVVNTIETLREFPDIKIIPLPGHTQGSIGVLADKFLFSGDLFMNMTSPSISWFAENFETLRQSARFILKQNLTTIFPGHGKPFDAHSIKVK